MVTIVKPKLLSSLNVFTGKEGNVWETEVLVSREHSTGKQVGLTHVIEEAADVAIETGIYAVLILRLIIQAEKVSVVLPHLCLCLRDDLTDILAHKGPLWYVL